MDNRPGVDRAGEDKAGDHEAREGEVVFTPREIEMIAEAEHCIARGHGTGIATSARSSARVSAPRAGLYA